MRLIEWQRRLFVILLCLMLASPSAAQTAAQPDSSQMPDLVSALKATPGCLGVETARTSSGKQVIFAWFENKKAVLNWYYSPTHQALMHQFAGDERRPQGPLADVPDDGRPVMAIASITLNAPMQGSVGAIKSATAQIAIELYAPLPGGVAAGGRFAPSSVKVPGLLDVPMPPK